MRNRIGCAALALLMGAVPALATVQAADGGLNDPNAIRVLLTPQLETTLSAQMNGTLRAMDIRLGQAVSKGATLAALDCSEVDARARVARAELNMAKQNLTAKRGLKELDAAGDIEVLTATTEVERAEGALTLATTQAGYCRVSAPFSGRVAKVYIKPYQTVAAGTPMFDLVSSGPLKVRLNVPSVLMRSLKPGLVFDVSITETGKSYPARISAVNARVDAVAQTVELEARLTAEYAELVAGMSGVARLPKP
ncbi:efflux RND transporter periplasmic adaptor subunit [Uliginosibacterium sp. H3]|uniref:Efflux RND transporter periplasmic adaptor subunit n=1 Tax=Uliginosibacterium silvisoli TaxID=3114758 RepID=A0ABU6JY77_9RHOO|nr:efflux RND transporter periplasmic adaptor subunit [Uliginosibacterium sp. H3]